MPTVSVVLPFRNAAETIEQAARSILDQEFRDLELIAVDDGSSDGSAACLTGIRDPRLRVIRNGASAGVVGASASGLGQASGEWFARMDADDLAMPGRIGRQLQAAKSGSVVITCGVELIDSQGDGMRRYVAWANQLTDHDAMSRSRFVECPVINPTAMVRMDWMRRVGGYHETSWAEDHDLWLRLFSEGCQFVRVEERLLKWRDSPDRLTRRDPRYGPEARSRMRAHHLRKLDGVAEHGVVIAGAGPIGKSLALHLQDEDVEVKGFFDVSPARVGQWIHGAEVASVDQMPSRWRSCVMLGAVGLRGARSTVRGMALAAGRRDGENYWAVC
ncbi:glycosyltransferase [Haloferula chungangensis]|uniref:Glycosyltransferase n=1 Tax=Haloferula chungangensis TaxID=1048331 RepID=A0ABW2L3T7_9BACT